MAPGCSTTTFKVDGNLIFEDGGTYDVEFGQEDMTKAGHYNDNTTVTGTTTIGEDSKITLNNLEGKYYVPETIDLINAGTLADGYEYKEGNVVFNDNDANDLRPGYDTRIYMWKGEGSIGANANVTFQNNSLTAKAQFGLE